MLKPNKFITLVAAATILFSPCAVAKKVKYEPPAFFKSILQSGKKQENPKLKEALSKIKKEKSNSEDSDTTDEFKKYDLEDNERNIFESCFAWLVIICVCIIIIRIICSNFKIPFDYDPNFKNKYVPRKKIRNKKYNFQKR